MDFDYWQSRVALSGINVLFAWSAYASYMVGSVSLGQAAFMIVGGYASASLTMVLGWHIVPAIAVGALLAGILGALVALPISRLSGLYLTIATLAFAEVTRIVLHNIHFGRAIVVHHEGMPEGYRRWIGPNGNLGFDYITYVAEHGISNLAFALSVMALVGTVGLCFYNLDRSRLGFALRAVAQDQIAAQSIGLNHTLIKVLAFSLGAALASVAGGLYAHLFTYVRPYDFGLSVAIVAIAYVVIGGGETFWGPALAAVALTFLPDMTSLAKGHQGIILGVLMIAMMVYRPSGLVTRRAVQRLGAGLRRALPTTPFR